MTGRWKAIMAAVAAAIVVVVVLVAVVVTRGDNRDDKCRAAVQTLWDENGDGEPDGGVPIADADPVVTEQWCQDLIYGDAGLDADDAEELLDDATGGDR